jgi:hypothetical protein
MAHKRSDIRSALVSIISGNTNAGTNVYANRSIPTWQSELPVILIYVQNETATRRAISSSQSIRDINVRIEIIEEDNDTLDSALDAIALQVENLLEANTNLNATASSIVLTGTDIETDAIGEKLVGKCILNYQVKYIE